MNGVVATSERHAVAAGQQILAKGGNAVDAALAAAMCLPVVEPTGNGVGGDLFALVWDGADLWGLDSAGASGATFPAASGVRIPSSGGAPVTVPGVVAGWGALHAKLGSLPWEALLRPAITLAQQGFAVGAHTAAAWAGAAPRLSAFAEWSRVFLVDGAAPRPGAQFRNPDLAGTLTALAEDGPQALYRGPLADRIAGAVTASGGFLAPADLAAHVPRWVAPMTTSWRGWTVCELPPPTQGLVPLLALRGSEGAPEATKLHHQIESMKLAFSEGWDRIADGADVASALSTDAIARLRDQIGPTARPGPHPPGDGHGTVLVCAGDEQGRLVTLIQSNFHGFGSGLVVPGTGITMQNRGLGFVPSAAHPNSAAPRRRPFHTLIPGLVLDSRGAGHIAFGCMGGQMQPQGHLQILEALRGGASAQSAVTTPRWRWLPAPDRVLLEIGFPAEMATSLQSRGHTVVTDAPPEHFGGAQVVCRDGTSGSDPRKDGLK